MDHLVTLGTRPHTSPPPPTTTPSVVVAQLYSHGVLDRDGLLKAVLKLRLPHGELARALGLHSVKELFSEFLDPVLPNTEASTTDTEWTAWNFEDARLALFDHRPPREIAPLVNRTSKAVQMFRYRMFTQGCRVNKAAYELISEGHTPEAVAKLGFPQWLAEFTYTVHALQVYATTHRTEKKIKVIFT